MEWLRKEYVHNTNSSQISIHSQVFVFFSQDEEQILQKLSQVKPSFITNILIKIDENPNIRDFHQSFPDLNSTVVFSKANNDIFMTRKMFALISKVSSSVNRKVVFKNLKLKTKEFWSLLQMFSHVQEVSFEDCKIKFFRRKFKLNSKCRFKIKIIGIIRSGLKHKALSRVYKILKEQTWLSLCLSKVVVAQSDKDTSATSIKKVKSKTHRTPRYSSHESGLTNSQTPTNTSNYNEQQTMPMNQEIGWNTVRFYSPRRFV